MIRFLHTSDWQLGMTRHFLSEGAQERYNQARFDALCAMGRIAKDEQCQFMLVCGDAFDSNQVDRKTVARALEALKDVPVPVFILPGNHDPLNQASVYRSSAFLDRKPPHIQVLESSDAVAVAENVELVGAPWLTKRPVFNPARDVLEALAPSQKIVRILAAHGAVDFFTPDADAPGVLPFAKLKRALDEGALHFVALGDRHSLTEAGDPRIWYSGTPEATDFREDKPGFALCVELSDGGVRTKPARTGQWQFIERERVDVNTAEDVHALHAWLEDIPGKDRAVVRLNLVGTLSLEVTGRLRAHLDHARDVLGALDVRDAEMLVLPNDADFESQGFSGFAHDTVAALRQTAAAGGDEGRTAREALLLFLRLARGQA